MDVEEIKRKKTLAKNFTYLINRGKTILVRLYGEVEVHSDNEEMVRCIVNLIDKGVVIDVSEVPKVEVWSRKKEKISWRVVNRVYEYLVKHRVTTILELTRVFRLSESTITRALRQLRREGKVVKTGRGKNAKYVLVEIPTNIVSIANYI